MQQLYSTHKGSRVLPLTMEGKPVTGAEGQNGLYASAVVDDASGEYIVKAANTSDSPRELTLRFDGMKKGRKLTEGRAITLSSDDPDADNTLDNPTRIRPVETTLTLPASGPLTVTLPAKTFGVYILK